MNIIDIAIILIILGYGLLGAHRGFFKQILSTVGFILVMILAYYLKNPLAEYLSLHMPFFDLKTVSLNIILYQTIAFLILMFLLQLLLKLLIKITGVVEKLLRATIILGIPSIILGFIAGLLEGVAFSFILLFIVNQPVFKIDVVQESKISNKILTQTPILSNMSSNLNKTISDIHELIKEEKNSKLDLDSIDKMLENKVISKEYVEKLIDSNKINIAGLDSILSKYDD